MGRSYTFPTQQVNNMLCTSLSTLLFRKIPYMSQILELIQNEPIGVVEETLDFLLYECSIDDAPTTEEVEQWCDILNGRGNKFIRLAAICQTWLDEEQK